MDDLESNRGGSPDVAFKKGVDVRGRYVADEEGSWGEGHGRGRFILLEQDRGRDPDMFSLSDFVHSGEDV